MARIKKQYSAEFTLKAEVEILKGEKTATQLACEFAVHPVVLSAWKKQFLEMRPQISKKPGKTIVDPKNWTG